MLDFVPWTGRVLERRLEREQRTLPRLVRVEQVDCGPIDPARCIDWANARARERSELEKLEAHAAFVVDRGEQRWRFRVGDQERSGTFPSGEAVDAWVRAREGEGHRVRALAIGQKVAVDFRHLEIAYYERARPRTVQVARWLYEGRPTVRGLWKGALLLEDLYAAGLRVDGDQAFVQAVSANFDALGTAEQRELASGWLPLPESEHALPVRVWLTVRCVAE
jgi:hypothetical protein